MTTVLEINNTLNVKDYINNLDKYFKVPSFQRPFVSNIDFKRGIIDIMVKRRKGMVASIMLAKTDDITPDGYSVYNIVDGVQRTYSMKEFYDGKFCILDRKEDGKVKSCTYYSCWKDKNKDLEAEHRNYVSANYKNAEIIYMDETKDNVFSRHVLQFTVMTDIQTYDEQLNWFIKASLNVNKQDDEHIINTLSYRDKTCKAIIELAEYFDYNKNAIEKCIDFSAEEHVYKNCNKYKYVSFIAKFLLRKYIGGCNRYQKIQHNISSELINGRYYTGKIKEGVEKDDCKVFKDYFIDIFDDIIDVFSRRGIVYDSKEDDENIIPIEEDVLQCVNTRSDVKSKIFDLLGRAKLEIDKNKLDKLTETKTDRGDTKNIQSKTIIEIDKNKLDKLTETKTDRGDSKNTETKQIRRSTSKTTDKDENRKIVYGIEDFDEFFRHYIKQEYVDDVKRIIQEQIDNKRAQISSRLKNIFESSKGKSMCKMLIQKNKRYEELYPIVLERIREHILKNIIKTSDKFTPFSETDHDMILAKEFQKLIERIYKN